MKVIWSDYIQFNPADRTFVVKGTQFRPEAIQKLYQEKKDKESILSQGLSPEQLEACLEFSNHQSALSQLRSLLSTEKVTS